MRKISTLLFLALLLNQSHAFCQDQPAVVYPKSVGYFSFILPIILVKGSQTTNDFSNFKNGFAIGFPVGINVLYSDKVGFSYEITPTVKTTPGSSKTSNLLFDPGPMFRFKDGLAFIPRLAFETSGRYGVTPVLTKIVTRTNTMNYFVSISAPMRWGNNDIPSVGGNLQVGMILK